jgi:hypothetical protein
LKKLNWKAGTRTQEIRFYRSPVYQTYRSLDCLTSNDTENLLAIMPVSIR